MEINEINLDKVITDNEIVLIDFYADWCMPCQMMSRVMNEIEKENMGKFVVGKVDIDNNEELAVRYNIRNIPTILFFKNGKMVDKQVGLGSKQIYIDKINNLLDA